MLSFPNCKINLGLYVTNRRTDGYHDLETVFYPVGLKDALEFVPGSGEAQFHRSGLPVAGDPNDNLVVKAYHMVREYFPDQVPALDIYLHKVIPMGAGLGGGSADAAFMLRMLSEYCWLHLPDEQLAELALKLGSDCPFFIYNTPQFATGRGEMLEPLELDLSSYTIQLICPELHVSTAAAFGMIAPRPAAFDLKGLPGLAVQDWKYHIGNDFEAPVFAKHPELADIKSQLCSQGALYASISGSGSTIFGIFPKGQQATIQSAVPFSSHIL